MMTVNWTSSVQKIVVMMIKKEGYICCLEVTHLEKTGSCSEKKGLAGRIYGKISSGIHGNSAKGCIGIGKILDFGRKNQKDRKNPGLIVEMSRRRLLSNLANLAAYGVIHKSDLEEFSDKMKKILKKSWTIMELITNKFQCIDKKSPVQMHEAFSIHALFT